MQIQQAQGGSPLPCFCGTLFAVLFDHFLPVGTAEVEVIVQRQHIKLPDDVPGGGIGALVGEHDGADLTGIVDDQLIPVLPLGGKILGGIPVDMHQGIIQIDLARDEVIVIGGGCYFFSEGVEDPALVVADGTAEPAAAGIGPVLLGKPPVVHGGEDNKIRLLRSVAPHQLVIVQVKADGAADSAEVQLKNRRFGAVLDFAAVQLRGNQMVLVVNAHDLPVPADDLGGIAVGQLLLLRQIPAGGVSDVAVVLPGYLAVEIPDPVTTVAIVRLPLLHGKAWEPVAGLRHHDQIRLVGKDLLQIHF